MIGIKVAKLARTSIEGAEYLSISNMKALTKQLRPTTALEAFGFWVLVLLESG
jgi:hypothetical protein